MFYRNRKTMLLEHVALKKMGWFELAGERTKPELVSHHSSLCYFSRLISPRFLPESYTSKSRCCSGRNLVETWPAPNPAKTNPQLNIYTSLAGRPQLLTNKYSPRNGVMLLMPYVGVSGALYSSCRQPGPTHELFSCILRCEQTPQNCSRKAPHV